MAPSDCDIRLPSVEDLETLDRRQLLEVLLGVFEHVRAQGLEIERLGSEVVTLRAENDALRAEVADLKGKLNEDSSNSHRPPSSDPPGSKPAPPEKKAGGKRKRGAQFGHKGSHRRLVSADKVTKSHEVKPDACERCGEHLEGVDVTPQRHQYVELPPMTPTIIEWRMHALACHGCGHVTRAPLPPGVPTGCCGPGVAATIAVLSGAYRLSKEKVKQLLHDLFGIRISIGTVSNVEARVSKALEQPVEEAKSYVRQQPAVHADETGWRETNKRGYLWAAVTPLVAVFLVRLSRATWVAKELLGEAFARILISDRYSAYNWVPKKRRQVCWAHLKRDFQKIADSQTDAAPIGEGLVQWTRVLFHLWRRYKKGKLKRSSFRTYASELRVKIRQLLQEGAACEHAKTAGKCNEILKLESAMWTFARIEGVEPTNNAAERSLRHAVIWRKGSYGTQSRRGSLFVERILTVVGTLRLQDRNVLEYVRAACEASLRNETAPTLLPHRTIAEPPEFAEAA